MDLEPEKNSENKHNSLLSSRKENVRKDENKRGGVVVFFLLLTSAKLPEKDCGLSPSSGSAWVLTQFDLAGTTLSMGRAKINPKGKKEKETSHGVRMSLSDTAAAIFSSDFTRKAPALHSCYVFFSGSIHGALVATVGARWW